MKNIIASVLLLFLLLVVHVSYCHAQGQESSLLAAPYPGSTVETFPGVTDASTRTWMDARSRTYYSKDAPEKVLAHYTKLLGPFQEYEPTYIYNREVIAFKDVVVIVEKKGATVGEGGDSFQGGTFAGVTLYGKNTNHAYHYPVVQVYDKLEGAYLKRFLEADEGDPVKAQKRLEAPELKQIEARYEHLKWSYFVQVKEKKEGHPNESLSMVDILYDKYFTDPEAARMKEVTDLQKKLADASTNRKFDEAAKIWDRMMKLMQPDPKDEFTNATKCLEEMEKNAFATKIVIDMHPSHWDLTTPKN